MFQSRKTRRQRSRDLSTSHGVGGVRGCRLGVETMEGRLMLSATNLEFAPLPWQGAYAVDVVGHVDSGTSQMLRFDLSTEGGYLLDYGTTTSFHSSGSIGRIVDLVTNLSPSDLDSRGELFNGDADGSVHLGEFGSSGGLQPVVITNPTTGDTNAVTNTPLFVTPHENAVGSSEGGAIAIHSVLAGVRAEVAAGRQQSVAALASRDSAAVSSGRALSGEWGRAIVFELAGGEPAGGERSATGERGSRLRVGEATTQGDGPLSMTDGSGDIGTDSSSEQNATRRDGMSAEGRSQGEAVDPSRKQAAAEVEGVNGRRFDSEHGANTVAPTTRDVEVLSVAFEQVGDDGAARVESSTGAPWWRSWGLAPLLMALALERITARRSRHPQTEAPRSLVRTPLRRSQTGPGDRNQ